MINGEAVGLGRTPEKKKYQAQTWDDMSAEIVKCIVQEVTERNYDQNGAEPDECFALSQTKNNECAAN